MNMLISESFVNATKGYHLGEESEPYEAFTDDVGKLFRSLMREYGRCVSSVYVDTKNGKSKRIGWVFQKRMKYEDCDETFIREVWVTLHDAPPERTIRHQYHELSAQG